jgi:protein required for attachment to host cells
MYRVTIAIVDATRARLFQFVRTSDPEGLRDQLTEVSDLVDPARRLRPSELFSDSGTSSNHSGRYGFTFDDHRDEHMARLDTDFVRSIAAEIERLAADADRLVICASPRMLGRLRELIKELPGLSIDELPRNLVKLTPPQLRDQLASYELLPPPLPRATLRESQS